MPWPANLALPNQNLGSHMEIDDLDTLKTIERNGVAHSVYWCHWPNMRLVVHQHPARKTIAAAPFRRPQGRRTCRHRLSVHRRWRSRAGQHWRPTRASASGDRISPDRDCAGGGSEHGLSAGSAVLFADGHVDVREPWLPALRNWAMLLVVAGRQGGERDDYLLSSNASTESPVFSTRLGLSNGSNSGLWVRSSAV